MIDFSKLRVGDRVRVLGYQAMNRVYRQRLMALGLTRGIDFTVLRIAPLGDPIEILVRGCSLCLRKQEAQGLLIERAA